MTPRQTFPERRSDGSATVAAVFSESLSRVATDVDLAFAEWREVLSDVDVTQDLAAEPVVRPSDEGSGSCLRSVPDHGCGGIGPWR